MADDEIRIQLRRGTATEWSNFNPVLAVGEPGFDTSNGILKIGDGTTRWASLSGVSVGDNVSQFTNDAGYIISDNSVASGSDVVTNVISLTQEEYDLITPESGIVYLISGGSPATTSETNDLTSAVTWANVPDANITESSVIQHSGALRLTESQIVDLGNYVASGDNISLLTNDSLYVASDVTGITGASGINNIVQISQTDYDALGTYDQNTIYFIV